MNSRPQFKIFDHDDHCAILLTGNIDENADFTKLKPPNKKMVVLDLKDVLLLNSMGLMKWVQWVKDIKSGAKLFFRNCPPVVVNQLNILQGFLPMGAVVESIYVPYYCEECGHEEPVLATRGKEFMEGTVDMKEGLSLSAKRTCPACQGTMEWDIIPEKYFSFLKYRR